MTTERYEVRCTSAEAEQQYPGSLAVGRLYVRIDERRSDGLARIVDDSGEHHLYPASWFTTAR